MCVYTQGEAQPYWELGEGRMVAHRHPEYQDGRDTLFSSMLMAPLTFPSTGDS